MTATPLLAGIARRIAATSGRRFTPSSQESVGGGCINRALVLAGDGQKYFVKLNGAACAGMFAAEAEGLKALAVIPSSKVVKGMTT